MKFNLRKIRALGIDISDVSVKMVGLEKSGKDIKVLCFSKEKVPEGVVEKGEIKDENRLSGIISRTFNRLKGKPLKPKNVFVSLPEEKSFLDIVKVPFLPDEKLSEVVVFEAENVIPFPLNEVYFDFEKVQTTAKLAACQEILLVATPRRIVDSYFNTVKAAGFKPAVMEIESLSIARALMEKNFFSAPTMLVDFGETRTSLAIFAGKNLRFTATVPCSSRQLTKNIAGALGVSQATAEEMKKQEGLQGKKKVFEALVPAVNDLAEQIRHYLDYYQSHAVKCQEFGLKKGLQKILLCGAGSTLKGFVDFLRSELDITVELGNPLLNISGKKSLLVLGKEKSLSYATAIGLALRNL